MASKTGCKTAYKPEFAVQAAKLCGRLGAIDDDLAYFFGVDQKTINRWKLKFPKFLDALKSAKNEADSRVVRSLYQRAIGYSHKAVKIMQHEGKAFTKDYEEHYPPDVTACIFWLKNRDSEKWRDRQHVEHAVTKDLAEALALARKRTNASRTK